MNAVLDKNRPGRNRPGRNRPGRAALLGVILAVLGQPCLAQTAVSGTVAAPSASVESAAPAQAGEVAAIILASEETTLSAQMAGRILKIHFGLGEQAKSKSRLLEFDCSEGQAQLLAAEA